MAQNEVHLPQELVELAGTIASMRFDHVRSMGVCPDGWEELIDRCEGLEPTACQAPELRYQDEMRVLEGSMTVAEYNNYWCPHHIEAPHGSADRPHAGWRRWTARRAGAGWVPGLTHL